MRRYSLLLALPLLLVLSIGVATAPRSSAQSTAAPGVTSNATNMGTPRLAFGFDRYTERARRALYTAELEAHRLNSAQIEPQHLLLALLAVGGKNAAVFNRFAVSVDKAKAAFGDTSEVMPTVASLPTQQAKSLRDSDLAVLKDGYLPASAVKVPIGRELQDVLSVALKQSQSVASAHIGVEHLLLALLEQDSGASRFLANTGMTAADIRQQFNSQQGGQ
jgi:ATP-dependent Clp protease ATP-binding subunit ClpB